MYKRILAVIIAICAAFTLFAAGCDKKDNTTYTVTVNCGEGGTYALSPEGAVARGTQVTLTVLPDLGYETDTVEIDGRAVTLIGNKYILKVSADVNVKITFKRQIFTGEFPSEYIGVWNTAQGSGSLGSTIEIATGKFTYEGKEYTVGYFGDGFMFTVTDGDNGEETDFTFTLVPAAKGNYILELTYVDSEETFTVYYFKEGVDYSDSEITFPEELLGDWDAGAAADPISITANGIRVGTESAIVVSYNEAAKAYKLLVGGAGYTLTVTDEETLVLTGGGSSVTYTKLPPREGVLVPQFAGRYITNDRAHKLLITDEGEFIFDGVTYELYADRSGTMPDWFQFEVEGTTYNIEFFDYYVWVYWGYEDNESYNLYPPYNLEVNCGEGGSYVVTDPEDGFYVLNVTLKITADEGYVVDKVLLDGKDWGSFFLKKVETEEGVYWTYTFSMSAKDRVIDITFTRA